MDQPVVPRVELHCHSDGLLDPAMLVEICRTDPAYPLTPEAFAPAYPVADFAGFVRWWEFIRPIEGDLRYFYPIFAHHLARLKAQHVVYAEIMLAAGELPPDPGRAIEAMTALRAWLDQQAAGAIQVEFLLTINRQRPPDLVAARGALAQALYTAGQIVGVALAGPEAGYPVKSHHATFARLHEAGVPVEIHAGEWCGPESVWDALEYGYPRRIGHGVSVFQDPKLLDLVQERQIHLELCPTSNLRTGAIPRIEDHPITRARDLGLNFSVNSDDPGIFGPLDTEYALLAEVFGFTLADFQQIYANSLAARFQPRHVQ